MHCKLKSSVINKYSMGLNEDAMQQYHTRYTVSKCGEWRHTLAVSSKTQLQRGDKSQNRSQCGDGQGRGQGGGECNGVKIAAA